MSDFKIRLVQEKYELDKKIERLDLFIKSENFNKIDAIQMSLLEIQILTMKTYSKILNERIVYLNARNEAIKK